MASILILDTRATSSGRLLASILRKHGYYVLLFRDAVEALTVEPPQRLDFMIIDIATPDIDGCRFLVQVRLGVPRPRLLLRATAGVEAEARALAHAFGASFIAKPAAPE